MQALDVAKQLWTEIKYDLNEEYFGDRNDKQKIDGIKSEILITLPSILNRLVKEVEKGNVEIYPFVR